MTMFSLRLKWWKRGLALKSIARAAAVFRGIDPRAERGVAVLIVLWLMVLLAGVVAASGLTARSETRATQNMMVEAQARQAAQAAIVVAALGLFDPQPSFDAHAGRRLVIDVAETTVDITVREECGKIDLNTGWAALIVGLFTAAGPHGEGARAAQAVLDWRDPDQRPRPGGAEDPDYRAAGLPYGARDGMFESIEELWQVKGVTPALVAKVAPDLTIDCLNAGVDPLAASPAVLAAVPNLAASSLAPFVAAREDYLSGRSPTPPILAGGDPYLEPSAGTAFSIVAEVKRPIRLRWEAVVVLSGDAQRPLQVRAWRRPLSDALAE